MVLLPLVAMDFCSKFMAHEDLFYGLQIFDGNRYFTLDEVTRNYGWALHGDVELNSFANISSNICSVLGVNSMSILSPVTPEHIASEKLIEPILLRLKFKKVGG